jgi:phospholipase C
VEAAGGTEAELERARQKLQAIEHIVVLQLENRSFDHMLGYLGMPDHKIDPHGDGEFDTDVNGLVPETMFNSHRGVDYHPEPLVEATFNTNRLDPPHDADEVAVQLAGGQMNGFVEAWAHKLGKRGFFVKRWLKKLLGSEETPTHEQLKVVMDYVTPDMVPVFNWLARKFCVCDDWYCSVPGPTMPNRFFSVAGTTKGVMSNVKLLVRMNGEFESFFRYLGDQSWWRWYSSDPGILRAIDKEYRFDTDPELDHFAYFDKCTEEQTRTFLSDVRDGTLPHVAWIDPNFAIGDMAPLGNLIDTPGSNDDHPPSGVILAQKLVNQVYETIGRSERYWDKTLLVIYYDEHGGFHDHEPPPDGWGVRVPALLVGGRVKRGVCHEPFDHASVIKTILLRFGADDCFAKMPPRVASATDLSVALRDDGSTVDFEPVTDPGGAALGPDDLEPQLLTSKKSRANYAIEILDRALTDLQELVVKRHAIPLRTGVRRLGYVRSKRLVKVLRRALTPVAKVRQRTNRALPPRRP